MSGKGLGAGGTTFDFNHIPSFVWHALHALLEVNIKSKLKVEKLPQGNKLSLTPLMYSTEFKSGPL